MSLYIFMTVVLILFILFEVHYILRIVVAIMVGFIFERKGNIMQPRIIFGFVLTRDLDMSCHNKNHARFLCDLEVARSHFNLFSGLHSEVKKRKGAIRHIFTNIRYRRLLSMFSLYKVVTQLIYWDENAIYLEHRFINLNDGYVHAIVLSKQLLKCVNVEEVMTTLNAGCRRKLSNDLMFWIQSIEAAEERLLCTCSI